MYLSTKRRVDVTSRGREGSAHEAARGKEEPMYPDVAEGLLLDVHEVTIDDVRLIDGSALDLALDRILASNHTCNFNSFNSSI
jgi:hypothetical protein